MTIDRIGQGRRRNRGLFAPHQPHKVGHQAQVTPAVTPEGPAHISAEVEVDTLFPVLVAGTGVYMANDKPALLQIALDFAKRADEVDRPGRPGRAADHIEGSGRPIGKLNRHRLVVNHIVVTLPHTATIGIAGFEPGELFVEGQLGVMLAGYGGRLSLKNYRVSGKLTIVTSLRYSNHIINYQAGDLVDVDL